jgi:hypothetical protein
MRINPIVDPFRFYGLCSAEANDASCGSSNSCKSTRYRRDTTEWLFPPGWRRAFGAARPPTGLPLSQRCRKCRNGRLFIALNGSNKVIIVNLHNSVPLFRLLVGGIKAPSSSWEQRKKTSTCQLSNYLALLNSLVKHLPCQNLNSCDRAFCAPGKWPGILTIRCFPRKATFFQVLDRITAKPKFFF